MTQIVYVCDCETTGLDPIKNDIIEVCFWRLHEEEGKTWCLKPKNIDAIEDEALRINGHKREDITHATAKGKEIYRDPSIVLPEIEMWIMEDGAAAEDRIFAGQNPKFDYDFLIQLWKKCGHPDDFPFGFWMGEGARRENIGSLIDTLQIVRFIDLCTGKKRPRYGLGALVKDFKVTKAQAHRADGDVKMTRELLMKLIEPIKNTVIEKFADNYPE